MKNTLIWLSGLVFIVLLIPANRTGILVGVVCILCLFVLFRFCSSRKLKEIIGKAERFDLAIALIFWAVLVFLFIFRWKESSIIASAAARIHLSAAALLLAAGICSIVCLPFLIFVVSLFGSSIFDRKLILPDDFHGDDRVLKRGSILLLLCAAAGIITVCSTCSPLYPINETSCFFTVGKSMVHGLVLYRDIFDQKGPILYMIYAAAYLISNITYHGVWLIEIAACFVFLCFAYKLAGLFFATKSLLPVLVMGAVVYTQSSFDQGGAGRGIVSAVSYLWAVCGGESGKK